MKPCVAELSSKAPGGYLSEDLSFKEENKAQRQEKIGQSHASSN